MMRSVPFHSVDRVGKIARRENDTMMGENETIAAIATPPALGGISIIRISGPQAIDIAQRVFTARSGRPLSEKKGYTAALGIVRDSAGTELDTSVATVFRAPRSYTGEDVVELSCHGGVVVTRELLRAVIEAGAALAGPGEFTRRAFLNGKLSLTQAEAVADLIGAKSRQAMNAAKAQLGGALYRRIEAVQEELLSAAGQLSAWVDYPEEDIPAVENGALRETLQHSLDELNGLLATFDTGRMIREGVATVIAGKPNVGKSTLMNLLSGCERSIVTDIAGTTRDIVEETVNLGDVLLRLSDTAGLRETEDRVEQLGVQLARDRMDTADLVLAVFDSSAELDEEDGLLMAELVGKPAIAVVNKTDLPERIEIQRIREQFDTVISLSALDPSSLSRLETAVKQKVSLLDVDANAAMLASERQRECALHAWDALREALEALDAGMTLDAVTVTVEEGINALLELSGSRATEEVVNNVFSHFCVGK